MRRSTIVASFVVVAIGAGCTGCVASEHAHAQGTDSGRGTPITGVSCFANAQRRTGLTHLQQQQLCLSAPNPAGPVDCYVDAVRQLGITDDQAVILCRCSDTVEPVACWQTARAQSRLTDPEIAQMCSPTLALGLLSNCRAPGH